MVQVLRIQCEECNESVPAHDIINFGSGAQKGRQLCGQCFNAEVAKIHGLDGFENVRLEPIEMADCAGEKHQFHFQMRLLGNMTALEAFELEDGDPGGYQFQIVGDPQEDALALLGRMVGKIRRALSTMHIEEGRLGPQIIGQTVRGRIEWDDSVEGDLPLAVVDGRKYSWEDLGRMLMTFEGWQFTLDILDRSEEA